MPTPQALAKAPLYPCVPNDLIDDPTPKDQAIYVPSVSVGYAVAALPGGTTRPIPPHLPPNVLDFLSAKNDMFRISHAMASAGQFLNNTKRSIISERDRSSTLIIGDSGGYQVASGKLKIVDDGTRLRILRWLEANSDIAMTLDVPTGGLGKHGFAYGSYQECLDATVYNLRFFEENRRQDSGTAFLNVIQGNTVEESLHWYHTVKDFHFEGWAIAGVLRNDIYHLCRLILLMHRDGQLQGKRWMHVLGTNEPGTAVLLTALQRAVQRHLGHHIRFSFDTSTPFRILSSNKVLGFPRFTQDELSIEQVSAPAGAAYHDVDLPWPWPSAVGHLLRVSDLIVKCSHLNTTQRDGLGNHLLALHNLQALCLALNMANRRFDVELITGCHTVGVKEGRAAAAIDKIMQAKSIAALEAHVAAFQGLRKSYVAFEADEDRDNLD